MIENSYLLNQSQLDQSQQLEGKNNSDSVYFDRIHDSSDVKKLADELRDLVAGKGYDKFAEEIKNRRIMKELHDFVDHRKYQKKDFGASISHKAPITQMEGYRRTTTTDPNLGPYEVVPQTDMYYKDNNRELWIKSDIKSHLRGSTTGTINPFENRVTYPGEVVELVGGETSRVYNNSMMNDILRYTNTFPQPQRPGPIAPVYDVLVVGQDGTVKKQPAAPVVSIKETPLMMIPSVKATAPITSTIRTPTITTKELVVESKPVGPSVPLQVQTQPGLLNYGSNTTQNLPRPLIPSQPVSVRSDIVPNQQLSYRPIPGATNQYLFNDQLDRRTQPSLQSLNKRVAGFDARGETPFKQTSVFRRSKDGNFSLVAPIPVDELGQEYPRIYEKPDDSQGFVRRNIPSLMNTNSRQQDADFLQFHSEIADLKSEEGRKNDLVRKYQMNYQPYPAKDQFSLQSSTNAFYRAYPSDTGSLIHSHHGSSSYLPLQGVSERAYAPSANFRQSYENPHRLP